MEASNRLWRGLVNLLFWAVGMLIAQAGQSRCRTARGAGGKGDPDKPEQ